MKGLRIQREKDVCVTEVGGVRGVAEGLIAAVVSCHYSVHESTTHYVKKIDTKPWKCVTISPVSHHDPLFKN